MIKPSSTLDSSEQDGQPLPSWSTAFSDAIFLFFNPETFMSSSGKSIKVRVCSNGEMANYCQAGAPDTTPKDPGKLSASSSPTGVFLAHEACMPSRYDIFGSGGKLDNQMVAP
jgi:hypothetical protein